MKMYKFLKSKILFWGGITEITVVCALTAKRKYDLWDDKILGTENSKFLQHCENERLEEKQMFKPWVTDDEKLIKFAQDHGISLPKLDELTEPYFPDVKIELLTSELMKQLTNHDEYKSSEAIDVCVGGPPVATVALQKAVDGKKVLYVNYTGTDKRAIYEGAANHCEEDKDTESPAYTAGNTPTVFFTKHLKQYLKPTRYDKEVLEPNFPWLSLNIADWLLNPSQWFDGLSVALGNYKKAQEYEQCVRSGKTSPVAEEMLRRTKEGEKYLTQLNEYLGGELFSKEFGSLIVDSTENGSENLKELQTRLEQEGRSLVALDEKSLLNKYGFIPKKPAMEKTHDRVFTPDFLAKISKKIAENGSSVKNNWVLRKILVNPDQTGGVLEFSENKQGQEIIHHQKFSNAHFSLGITNYSPSTTKLVSVTGVSVNAILYGLKLKAPVVCGGSNHLVPLREPTQITVRNEDGSNSKVDITLVRVTAAGAVGPRKRGNNSYTYDGKHAIHLLHRVKETLPEGIHLEPISVIGCNRMFIEDGMSMWKHPTLVNEGNTFECSKVKIHEGAGGGGLTQCAVEAIKVAENSDDPFHMTTIKNSLGN